MIFTPFAILVAISVLLTVLSFIWPTYPLLSVAVLLLGVALLVSPK